MLCFVFIIIGALSIRACPRSPPLENRSMRVKSDFSSSLKNPIILQVSNVLNASSMAKIYNTRLKIPPKACLTAPMTIFITSTKHKISASKIDAKVVSRPMCIWKVILFSHNTTFSGIWIIGERDPLTLRGCYENMDKYNLEKFEVKVYDCNEFLCNGASDGFGNVGLFFFLPLIIVYIFWINRLISRIYSVTDELLHWCST